MLRGGVEVLIKGGVGCSVKQSKAVKSKETSAPSNGNFYPKNIEKFRRIYSVIC
jgi:hypothetical protein